MFVLSPQWSLLEKGKVQGQEPGKLSGSFCAAESVGEGQQEEEEEAAPSVR